jgi:hypothetical protein
MLLTQVAQAASDAVTSNLVSALVGALGGTVGTLVTMRTRMSHLKRDITDETKQRSAEYDRIERDRLRFEETIDSRIKRVESRQLVSLRLTADIARHVGVDNRRFDDALVRMLTEEDPK